MEGGMCVSVCVSERGRDASYAIHGWHSVCGVCAFISNSFVLYFKSELYLSSYLHFLLLHNGDDFPIEECEGHRHDEDA